MMEILKTENASLSGRSSRTNAIGVLVHGKKTSAVDVSASSTTAPHSALLQHYAKVCLVCTQAQREVAQLQSQLQDAVTQQEALQQALHDMQSTIAVLRHQIQQQAQAGTRDADAHPQPGIRQRGGSSSMQQLSQAAPAGALVLALQQQVADLKELTGCLGDSQQQQHLKHQLSQSVSLDRRMHHGRACGDMAGPCGGSAKALEGRAGSPRGLSASGPGLKHDYMMPSPGPRSVPKRRLPMSSYASPASQPDHLTDVIKAHHASHQSAAETTAGDKCWCGRPKKLTGPAVSTPSKPGAAGTVDGLSSAAKQHCANLHTPSRFIDR